MRTGFDDVDLERLRRRQTVKWTLHGPEVLAAWVAEMDFDIGPAVRSALLAAIEREDLGYTVRDLSELTRACADFPTAVHGWTVAPARIFPIADALTGIAAAFELFVPAGRAVVVPTPAYPPFFEIVELGGREPIAVPMVVENGRAVLDLDRISGSRRASPRTAIRGAGSRTSSRISGPTATGWSSSSPPSCPGSHAGRRRRRSWPGSTVPRSVSTTRPATSSTGRGSQCRRARRSVPAASSTCGSTSGHHAGCSSGSSPRWVLRCADHSEPVRTGGLGVGRAETERRPRWPRRSRRRPRART